MTLSRADRYHQCLAVVLAGLTLGSVQAMAVGLVLPAAAQTPADADRSAPALPAISGPPSLDLQRMMEALRDQAQPSATQRDQLNPQVIPPRLDGLDALPPPSPPAASATTAPAVELPDQIAPLEPEASPSAPVSRPVPPVTLPSSLAPFTEPAPPPVEAPDGAAASDGDTPGDQTTAPTTGLPGAPPGAIDPSALFGGGAGRGIPDVSANLSADIEQFVEAFGRDAGMAVTADPMRAQHLAISFIDYLYRLDRPRIRAIVGVPFYADNFPIETDEHLNRLLGEPAPILGPPLPVTDDRQSDQLIGVSTMRITELRTSEFYVGDRGADLIGLDEDDFFVHAVFLRNGQIAAIVVYVRQTENGGFEIAGFFD